MKSLVVDDELVVQTLLQASLGYPLPQHRTRFKRHHLPGRNLYSLHGLWIPTFTFHLLSNVEIAKNLELDVLALLKGLADHLEDSVNDCRSFFVGKVGSLLDDLYDFCFDQYGMDSGFWHIDSNYQQNVLEV